MSLNKTSKKIADEKPKGVNLVKVLSDYFKGKQAKENHEVAARIYRQRDYFATEIKDLLIDDI